ncbi:MAG: 30S ribosomal protein S20 [Calditrichaeota bacterium]|nr:30S ribosomal protein S20 [Calditrichota bacterium]MBT7616391.1 30S ribosomal protein S20 [Calditrichota bacterium]MBT7788293.1 30S ribosomal protein S20 [Calditrichota bacterium]
MAHHKSALKRIKTSRKANERNRQFRTKMRNSIRKLRESENSEARQENLRSACAILDRLVSKGVVHRKTASRRKSRLSKFVASQAS